MITILLGILCSTGVLILFKLLPKLRANTSHTIFSSYAVAALFGFWLLPVSLNDIQAKWTIVAAIEGMAFYTVFHLMARSAVNSGVAFTSVASKMSVVIPITIGLAFLGDSMNILIVAGVISGLFAVLLTVGNRFNTGSWHWPVLVFLGTGIIDASFKLYQVWGLTEDLFPAFIISIFAFAFLTSLIFFALTTRVLIKMPSIYAGIGLGLLNLGTVYFLMQALAIKSLDSTVVYALNSFGIVLTSMLVAIILFREKISKKAYLGIALAFISIVLIYFSSVS